VVGRQKCLELHGQEAEDLFLGLEAGAELGGGDLLSVSNFHGLNFKRLFINYNDDFKKHVSSDQVLLLVNQVCFVAGQIYRQKQVSANKISSGHNKYMKNTSSNKPATGKPRQSTLNQFVNRSSSSEGSDPETQVAKAEEQKRREISDWTGVMSRDQFTDKETKVANIAADIKALLSEKVTVPPAEQTEQLVLFDPDVYKGKEQQLTAGANALTLEQRIDYGKMVTEVRADITSRANMMEAAEHQKATTEADAVDADAIQLKRTYTPLKEKRSSVFQHQGTECGMRPDLQKKAKLR